MKICFATNNESKIKEIQALVGESFQIVSLKDIGCEEELAEEQATLEGNALQKAAYVAEKFKVNCFADDTGLLVSYLNGEPGVYSARYAGPQRSNTDNINLLLSKLKGVQDREAFFKTVICAIIEGQQHFFEGKAHGIILEKPTGTEGFGYDPIFQPNGFDRSFAQMTLAEKNKISHRGMATREFINFLRTNFLKGD